MIKQVIVTRTDLNMRKGKMIAQGGHAVLGRYIQRLKETLTINHNGPTNYEGHIDLTDEELEWFKTGTTKISLGIPSEAALLKIYHEADYEGLPVYLVTDSGVTEFHGEETVTCLAIGPAPAERIDKITGHLTPL